ncbi:MAG: hypothetical protein FWC00_04745 [Firmicutes bacterium]|nr:hypothetical protein [Bacillota bacterium]
MKRIKALIRRTTSGFTVSMSQKPIIMTILLLLLANLVFVAIAAVALTFINDEYNFFSAIVSVGMWLVVPAGIANIYDTNTLILGWVVVVVGMLLFTGTIIALVTTTLREYLMNKSGARGRLNLSGHIVILRYNNEVPEILIDIMKNCDNKTVLVLSDRDRSEVRSDLLAAICSLSEKPKGKIKLLVRKGDPASLSELDEIDLENASGLLIMNERGREGDKSGHDLCQADFSTLKLVFNLASVDLPAHVPIGVETASQSATDDMERVQKTIDGLSDKNITYFSHNKKLGHFMAKIITDTGAKKLFIIGENKKLDHMLEALGTKVTIAKYATTDIEKFAIDLSKKGDENTAAIVLSDDSVTEENYDANVFLTLIELSTHCSLRDRKFKIIAEILDPNNHHSLEKFHVQNIVISTRIISNFASDLVLNKK